MDKSTSLLGFLAALSLTTERITETMKGLQVFSRRLALEKLRGSTAGEFRKACIHDLAMRIGTLLTGLTHDQMSSASGLHDNGRRAYLLFGAIPSGVSGKLNSEEYSVSNYYLCCLAFPFFANVQVRLSKMAALYFDSRYFLDLVISSWTASGVNRTPARCSCR